MAKLSIQTFNGDFEIYVADDYVLPELKPESWITFRGEGGQQLTTFSRNISMIELTP